MAHSPLNPPINGVNGYGVLEHWLPGLSSLIYRLTDDLSTHYLSL